MFLQVCLPGLHISLGIFLRLFTLLEDACHKLDFKLAQETSPSQRAQTSFAAYSQALRETRELQEERQRLDEEATTLEQVVSYLTLNLPTPLQHPTVSGVATEAKSRRDQISHIVRIQCHTLGMHCEVNNCNPLFEQDKRLLELAALRRKGFEKVEGPFVQGLDTALASFNVARQAYYSGTFIGNHVHRTLKVKYKLIYDYM